MKTYFIVGWLLTCLCLHAQIPKPDHVVIVIFENHQYSDIIGYAGTPYINSLANDPYGALFTQSFAVTHPSQPNYLHLFSGSDQGVTSDGVPSGIPFKTANLGASLLNKNYTFTGYAEDLPSAGWTGSSSGAYARKHCPWINWQGSGTNGIPGSLSQPFSKFPTDYSKLPAVSFVIPNMNNDMHDGTREQGDTWLQNNLSAYVTWAKSNNSLLILTFDEDDYDINNHITTIFVGQMVKQGQYNEAITHHNILRTLEDMYSLSYAGNSVNVSAITDTWIASALPITLTDFEAHTNGESVELTWTTATEVNNDFFTVENSSDGITFKSLVSIDGAGTSNQEKKYSFMDRNPFYEKSFYRLKQTDYDGNSSYSKIVSVNVQLSGEKSLSVYPNPSAGSFTISLENFESNPISLTLTDLSGKILYSTTFGATEKMNFEYSDETLTELQPGFYLLHATDGRVTLSERIVRK